MDAAYTVSGRQPSELSEIEIQDFIAMVRAGGEVGDHILDQNVRNAELLLTIHKGQCLVAVATLDPSTGPTYLRKLLLRSVAF